ncbi:MerR family transcriptional regulator [Saccharothrix sp. BKS2]|uniref:MerR family transcriptional regulator n=1 Tax=Saccharothrix sp. BKS2 TaxID=3064400 RepID=UPI0039EAC25B
MHPSFTPPHQVEIGDAAAFAGTTPRAVRHYHEIGLLPEPERGADGRRRYGYDDVIRLLWIRRMAEAGISPDDVRAAFDDNRDVEEGLGRLEETLAAKEAGIKRRRAVVQRLRAVGSPLGLLSELVTDRLGHLPRGAPRRSDLDTLLVTERVFGPLGAAVQASVFIVLATHPDLRAEDDRLDAAEAALDDGVDPHDADPTGEEPAWTSAAEAVTKMPYGFSPARIRCVELAGRLLAQDHAADNRPPPPHRPGPTAGRVHT